MDHQAESELKKKIERLDKLLNLPKIIGKFDNSPSSIRRYYRINSWAYRKFHSDRGFMHLRITRGEKMQPNDIFYQPDVIARFIPENGAVVELGPGQGANIFYLAAKFPCASFTGVDLKPPKKRKDLPNVVFRKGDYADLSFIPDGSADVVYGIETIVHNTDKERIMREVFRILRPGGVFVVYDYALIKEYGEYLPFEQTAIDVTSGGGACARIESQAAWETHFKACGFDVEQLTPLTREILPDLKRLCRKSKHIMDHDRRVRIVFRLFPSLFVNNILVGYLGYDCYNEGGGNYDEWICRKPGRA